MEPSSPWSVTVPQTPEAMRAYMQRVGIDSCGFTRFLDIAVTRCWDGACELGLAVRPDLIQAFGTLHGAVLAGLADIACGFAAFSRCGPAVTADLGVRFTAPVRAGVTLRATARVESVEGRCVGAAATFRSAAGDDAIVLTATARLVVLPAQAPR